MATVHIPAHWRALVDGRTTVEVSGRSLGAVIDALGIAYPALHRVLVHEGALRGEVAIAIDSVITENDPLEPVGEHAEIFLVPAIAGG
jgi:molybdopterin converting factor small subunit